MAEAFTNAFDYDFIGFTYNKLHSIRDLGIYRVSNGSRYDNQIAPTLTENTMDIPGNDGMYFFGTYHKQKTFSINIAFDSMTESQLRKLRQLFNGKEIGELIFDETPYKAYSAKITGTPTIKVICFDELKDGKMQRVYKGEGTLQFVCYSPYAYTPDWCWSWNERLKTFEVKEIDGRYLSNYPDSAYPQKHQWDSQALWLSPDEQGIEIGSQNSFYIPLITEDEKICFLLVNRGDLPTPFEMILTKDAPIPAGTKIGFQTAGEDGIFKTHEITILEEVENTLRWDSKTGIISQLKNGEFCPINFSGNSCVNLLMGTKFIPQTWPIFDPIKDDIKFKFWYY